MDGNFWNILFKIIDKKYAKGKKILMGKKIEIL